MTSDKIDLLSINGIRDDGSLDDIRADSKGRVLFSSAGSCNFCNYLPNERVNVNQFVLDHLDNQQIDGGFISKHKLIVSEISDPDSHSRALIKAKKLFDIFHDKIPWINNPHRVTRTGRDKVPELLSGIDNVVAPGTIRASVTKKSEFKSAMDASALSLPVLIRPVGSHYGKNLVLITDYDDLDNLNLADYQDAYITEFVDCSNNGIYSKYRFAVVAGDPLLRHVLFKDHWMVHADSRAFTADKPEYRKVEADTLASFENELKLEVRETIDEIYQRIGLDYFGIDCALQDGKLVLFEVNANMNILKNTEPLPNIWEGAIDKILNRIMDELVIARAK